MNTNAAEIRHCVMCLRFSLLLIKAEWKRYHNVMSECSDTVPVTFLIHCDTGIIDPYLEISPADWLSSCQQYLVPKVKEKT